MLAAVCLGFFGVVTYQNTEAMSTARQQTVLKTLSAALIREAGKSDSEPWESVHWLNSQPLLTSPELFALVVNRDNRIVNRSNALEKPGHALPVSRFLPPVADHEQFLSIHGCRYVWTVAVLPGTEDRLILVHASDDDGTAQLVQYYLVPTIIAVLFIIWALVWVRLSVLRRIRIMARQEQLETELVREQEASRIKSTFLAHMSHELRTPLNAIIGFAQMLRNETFGPLGSKRNVEYVGIIHDAGTHLSRLIGHVLDLSQLEAGSTDLNESETHPTELFEECETLARSLVEARNQQIMTSVSPAIGAVRCDRLRMVQVLLNLLGNASKFSPQGSRIRLEASMQGNGDLLFQVIDRGRGIAADDIAQILKPFGQAEVDAETARDGTGLGLPLSQSLLELHGGSLTINSIPGQGTTVTARLPASRHRPDNAIRGTELPLVGATNR